MFIEMQISGSSFGRILRNNLRLRPICLNYQFDYEGTSLVIDRVLIGDETIIQREQYVHLDGTTLVHTEEHTQTVWVNTRPVPYTMNFMPFVQVRQEISVVLVEVAALESNGVEASPAFKLPKLHAVFNVGLQVEKPTQGGGKARLVYEFAQIDWGIYFAAIPAAIRTLIEQKVAAIGISPTEFDLSALSSILRRPVKAINAGIACTPGGNVVALRIDVDIDVTPAAVNRAFFEAGPVDRLGNDDWAIVVDAALLVEGIRSQLADAVGSIPKVKHRWGPNVSWIPSQATVKSRLGIEVVDACLFFVDNIDLNVDVEINTSFSVSANALTTNFHIDFTKSNVLEVFACTIVPTLIWPITMAMLYLDKPQAIPATLPGLILAPALTTFVSLLYRIETQGLENDISGQLGNNCQKIDDSNYRCIDPIQLNLPVGPTAPSRLDALSGRGVPEGLVIAGRMRHRPEVSAGAISVSASPFTWVLDGSCKVGFSIINLGQIEVTLTNAIICEAFVIDTPWAFTVSIDGGLVRVRPKPGPFLAGFAPVYPCRVHVVTSAGVRTISLGTPNAITDAEKADLEARRRNFEKVCQMIKDAITIPIDWKPVPVPPLEDPGWLILRSWQIAVKGLVAGEPLHLEDRDGRTLMSARASEAGVAHLSLMLPQDASGAGDALVLRLEKKQRRKEAVLAGQQTLFVQVAELPIEGPVRVMRFEGAGSGRRLLVTGTNRKTVWDVGVEAAPGLVSSERLEDDEAETIVFTGEEVGVEMSPRLREAVARLAPGERPVSVGSPRIGGVRESLYLDTGKGPRLYEIGGDEAVKVQSFADQAWFPGTAIGGHLMARHDPERSRITLFAARAVTEI